MLIWEVFALLATLGTALGVVAAVGGVTALAGFHNGSRAAHAQLLSYALAGALLGLHASLFAVLVQVGEINGQGIVGMFDLDMLLLLRGTPAWEAAAFQGVGFGLSCLLLLSLTRVLGLQRQAPELAFYRIAYAGQTLALGLVLYGFTLSGHVSVLSWPSQLALVLHVATVATWVGMLFPLRWACNDPDTASLQKTMRRFGRLGIALVAVLSVSGAVLLLNLIDPIALLTSSYGRLLLLKLGGFVGLVAIAAQNRFSYVPNLEQEGGARALRRSIDREIALALTVLLVAAAVSTLLGPATH